MAVVNLAGFAFGLWYYAPQLSRSNPAFWFLVLDSPLSVLLAAFAFALAVLGAKSSALNSMAGTSCFKYGVWTLFVLAYFKEFFFSPENAFLYAAMFATHLGMVAEGLFFAGLSKPGVALGAAGAWLFANDFFDYSLGMHTSLPAVPEKLFTTAVFSALLTAFTTALFYFLSKKKANLFASSVFLTRVRGLLE